MAGKVHWDSHESSLLALLSFGEVCCYACILFRASGHPFQAEGTCGFWMLPRAWGHAEPMWGWEARWGWWGGAVFNPTWLGPACPVLGCTGTYWLGWVSAPEGIFAGSPSLVAGRSV